MRRPYSRYWWVLPFGLWITFLGCQSTEELATDPEFVATAPMDSPASASDQPPATSSPSRGPEIDLAQATTVAQFSPPFADRLELFVPPKRAQSAVRNSDNEGETVELKGFIHVDQPRVVLSIDGVISPIAQGGEKYGVQVISIQPPSVVLQRGRSRWTATLE